MTRQFIIIIILPEMYMYRTAMQQPTGYKTLIARKIAVSDNNNVYRLLHNFNRL